MSISDRIRVLKHVEGLEQLLRFARDNRLIPIFGSGMTTGASVAGGKNVPDGATATVLMKDLILEVNHDLTNDDIASWDFNKTAENFYDHVDTSKRDEFFRQYFSNVSLNDYRANFFRLQWPRAYTLNVDNGIESCAKYYPVIPYKEIKKDADKFKLLYKLHGDAHHEMIYKENNIVFSSNQYIKAIKDRSNKSIYNALIRDYTQNNILYCGCSLAKEPDIEFFVSTIKKNLTSGNARIVLKNSEPTTSEKIDLLKYGINEVVVVDNYRLFFEEFCAEIKKTAAHIEAKEYKFINPTINELDSRDFALQFLSKNTIFIEEKNEFNTSKIKASRTCVKEIEKELDLNNSVVVKGRRFSGKSMVLMMLCATHKAYSAYYFPSGSTIDSDALKDILTRVSNCIFLFDSNSLSKDSYLMIAHASTSIKVRNNKIVIAVNSNDNYIINNLQSGFIEIDAVFDLVELNEFNNNSDELGIVRRANEFTNIDFAKHISMEYGIKLDGAAFNITKFSFHEKILILMLSALDKVYYGDIATLEIDFTEVDNLVKAFDGIILESIPTAPNERERDSLLKLVHNSKIVLLNILGTFTDDDIVSCLYHIVNAFKGDRNRERLYIDVIMFDTLNQLFPKNNDGAGRLIPKVYDNLHPLLNNEPHYWLQRSKSLYRLFSREEDKIKESLDWAKKAYNDGDSELKPKAALSTAIIFCLLSEFAKDTKQSTFYSKEIIKFAYEAINSPYFNNNKNQFKNELSPKYKKKTGLQFVLLTCEDYLFSANDKHTALYKQADFVCSNLKTIQCSH
jgi:hypothetical protein